MRANKAEVVNAACNVVEALNALEASEKANDGTTKRYRDHLGSCIYRLKFLIERDNKSVIKRLRVQIDQRHESAVPPCDSAIDRLIDRYSGNWNGSM